mmetsp:Transcript_26706/g.68634  ORF Transcript_26706/g.68634 Transcript_26706/m.68634 type:complete len:462 (-) Transcript_26706:2466-3851(-)
MRRRNHLLIIIVFLLGLLFILANVARFDIVGAQNMVSVESTNSSFFGLLETKSEETPSGSNDVNVLPPSGPPSSPDPASFSSAVNNTIDSIENKDSFFRASKVEEKQSALDLGETPSNTSDQATPTPSIPKTKDTRTLQHSASKIAEHAKQQDVPKPEASSFKKQNPDKPKPSTLKVDSAMESRKVVSGKIDVNEMDKVSSSLVLTRFLPSTTYPMMFPNIAWRYQNSSVEARQKVKEILTSVETHRLQWNMKLSDFVRVAMRIHKTIIDGLSFGSIEANKKRQFQIEGECKRVQLQGCITSRLHPRYLLLHSIEEQFSNAIQGFIEILFLARVFDLTLVEPAVRHSRFSPSGYPLGSYLNLDFIKAFHPKVISVNEFKSIIAGERRPAARSLSFINLEGPTSKFYNYLAKEKGKSAITEGRIECVEGFNSISKAAEMMIRIVGIERLEVLPPVCFGMFFD